MPITFEEVTGEIEPDSRRGDGTQAQAPREAPAEDLSEQIERALRLREQRLQRLCAD